MGRRLNTRPGFDFPDCFYISIASHNTINRLPLWRKGKWNWILWWPLYLFFQTFPPLFLGSFGGDLLEGRFSKIQLHCGFYQVRMWLFRCSTFLCVFKHSLVFQVIPAVDCWCGCKVVNLVTSIRQPISGRLPLIVRSSSSLIWFHSFHFGWSRKKSALSNISSMKRICNSLWNSGEFNFILPLFVKPLKHKGNLMSLSPIE